jgi:putative peptide zinc metalloprotease protein
MEATSLWEALNAAAHRPSHSGQSLWAWLAAQLDLAQSRPQAITAVVESRLTGRDGVYYILKNPAAKTYFRLSDRDYFLWQRLDGAHTVKDLVVAYFTEYKAFAFARVTTLLEGLKSNRFLVEQPVNVYQQINSQLQRRRPQARFSALWAAFQEKQFAIRGVDRGLTRLYQRGGWLVYSWPAQILCLLVTLAGLYCYYRAMQANNYGLINVAGSYLLGVITLVIVSLFSISIHELAHALTVKHFRREVVRGGFMLYMGMPAFFVDTTDIWLEGKRARLAVSWAGPYVDLIQAGLASLALQLWPHFALNPLLFQFAFVTYVSVLFNLNPLLELDGYFLLMDGLEIPMLRRKSLEFIRSGLWAKLKSLRATGKKVPNWLSAFSWEERVFAIFGLLSGVWTIFSLVLAILYWQEQFASVAGSLWAHGGLVGKIVVGAGAALIGGPLAFGVGLALWSLLRQALALATWLGLFATPWRVAACLLILSLAAGVTPIWYPPLIPLISLAALAAAIFFAARSALDYAGSRFAPVFWLLGAALCALALSRAGHLVGGWRFPWLDAMSALSYLSLGAAGLALFGDTNLRDLQLIEKAGLLLGWLASYGLVAQIAAAQGAAGGGPAAVVVAVMNSLPLLALTLLFPTLVSFWRTGFGPAWLALGLALAALLGTEWLGLPPHWACLLFAVGLGLHQVAYARRAAMPTAQVEASLKRSDYDRLKLGFAWAVDALSDQLREATGERRSGVLVSQFNTYALAAGWRLHVTQGQVEDMLPAQQSLRQRGDIYAAALSLLLDLMAGQIGEKLTVRALQRAYDTLPWEAREVAAQYLFPEVERAQTLGQQFRTTQQSYRSLLQRIPLFATLAPDEIDLLCSRLQAERFAPGRAIIRQGERGDRFYILTRGSVEVIVRNPQGVSEVVNQLGRGDYFGQVALLNDAPRNATCRAIVPTEALSLSRADFDRLVKVCFELREKMESSIGRLNLLRQMPLFADMDGQQLQLIAAHLREETAAAGATVIREGEVGRTFYLIESGRVQVTVAANDGERVIAEAGGGEYVGEMALLLQQPRTATVRAITPTCLLALDKTDFDHLVVPQLYTSRSLEQQMSRRMLELRRAVQNT